MRLHYQLKTLVLDGIGAAVFFVFLFRYIHIAFNIGYILKDAGSFRAYGALRPRAGQSSSAGSGATCSSAAPLRGDCAQGRSPRVSATASMRTCTPSM